MKEVDGRVEPVDLHEDPPNGEYDNLYLDMNALIHPCCHPEDGPPPVDEEHMFELIFLYIDRLIRVVRPKKLVYMAIDGVAPRAKMNQQRSRRFRAAQERQETEQELRQLRTEWEAEGRTLPSKHAIKEPFDSNVITPGTPFMYRLAEAFKYYIHDRTNNDPLWQKLKFRVIFSDCQFPGEGEHKIMRFIRAQRSQPEYDPNTRHMLYGADADLIMLGLATHETHFHIIREVVIPKQDTKCTMCGQSGHVASECLGDFNQMADDDDDEFTLDQKPFQILSLPILRQYLGVQFGSRGFQESLPFPFDFERIIDDFVFFCFFVGNDFLPHLPSLSIRDGSIDQMCTLYLEILPEMGDYITNNGVLNLEVAESFLEYIGGIEDQVFKNRLEKDKKHKQYVASVRPAIEEAPIEEPVQKKPKTEAFKTLKLEAVEKVDKQEESKNDMGAAWHAKLLAESFAMDLDDLPDDDEAAAVTEEKPETTTTTTEAVDTKNGTKVEADAKEAREKEEAKKRKLSERGGIIAFHSTVKARLDSRRDLGAPREDTIRLGEGSNWKQRYYFDKFCVKQEDLVDFLQRIRKAYTEGMCWVLAYYYQGCPSWTWYYPYHYAPFASDLIGMNSLNCNDPTYFKLSRPFKPFQQLMSVLPPDSANQAGIPQAMKKLMTEPESPIVDFFPTNFGLDLNGKRFTWQAVILLPFLDEPRLLKVLQPYLEKVEEENGEAAKRNAPSTDLLFAPREMGLEDALQKVGEESIPLRSTNLPIGYCRGKKEFENLPSPFEGLADVKKSNVVSTEFELPEEVPHSIQLLDGATFEPQVITEADHWHLKNLKGFGGEFSRRMILNALGRDWRSRY